MSTETLQTKVIGQVLIKDSKTGEVLVNKKNAVHPENMARILARALARETNGFVHKLVLGNGGTYLNASDQIVFNTPNVVGGAATLFNQTYEEIIDESNVSCPIGNSVTSASSPPPALTSMVVCTMELDPAEPLGQSVSDDVPANPDFVFDELGLASLDGYLLTHVVFSPIAKTANRGFTITYTLTVSVS
jgi:hypothetical protein